MIEREVEISTPDGSMGTFVCYPERGGPHHAILFLMDGPGIREELRDMCRRLATVGYYVMLPNLYHRDARDELGDWNSGAAVRSRIGSLMGTISLETAMRDVDGLIEFLDADPAASPGSIGALGYCMSGKFAVSATLRHPDRIAAAASIYGTGLVTDAPDSVHRRIATSEAELYFAWAELDSYAPIDQVASLARALRSGGAKAEVEVYHGANHGFAFKSFATFDRPASDRHWERLFELFGKALT